MIILDFIFRNKPWLIKKSLTDDIFGIMWYNKEKDPEFNHYQAHFTFRPTNSEIDIFLDSDKDGFDSKQKSFFKEIEKKYQDIIEKSVFPIEELLQKKKGKTIKIQDFRKEFALFAISIPRIPNKKWTLSFTSEKHSLMGITVQYNDWEVIDIL
jgi:hypothetical protein